MKTKHQPSKIELHEITDALGAHGLTAAREILSAKIGAALVISGTVEKVITRQSKPKLFIITETCKVFAELDTIIDRATVRKGQRIEIDGSFQSFGYEAVTLTNCRIIKIDTSSTVKVKKEKKN